MLTHTCGKMPGCFVDKTGNISLHVRAVMPVISANYKRLLCFEREKQKLKQEVLERRKHLS